MAFPGVYPFTITRGSTFSVVGIQLIGGSGPFNLDGFTPRAQVRLQSSAEVILDFQPEVADAASGMIEIPSISDEDTLELPLGVYHWDFLLVDLFNEVFGPFVIGPVYIVDKITDS